MTLVLLRKLNARNIELHHDTEGETVGVLIRNGEYRYLPWLGFIERDRAMRIGKPVKLLHPAGPPAYLMLPCAPAILSFFCL